MKFEIQWNIFREQLNWPIIPDWRLSPEELRHLRDFLREWYDEIIDQTQGQLARFLHEDVIPNLQDSSLPHTIRAELLSLAESYPLTELTPDTQLISAEISYWISERYWISSEVYQNLETRLWLFWVEGGIERLLESYNNFIESRLHWFDEQILTKIRQSIGMRIWNISNWIEDTVSTIERRWEQWSESNYRWIINGYIQDELWIINTMIFPSALLLHTWRTDTTRISSLIESIPSRGMDGNPILDWWNQRTQRITRMLANIERMFEAPLDSSGNFNQWWPNRLRQANNLHLWTEDGDVIFQWLGWDLAEMEWFSILSEEDKAIERNAMLWFMWGIAGHIAIEAWPAVLASIVPWVGTTAWVIVWSLAGASIDFSDVFSSRETILVLLQEAWVIPREYEMWKTLIDHILAGIWLIPWATIAIKWAKLTGLMRRFRVTSEELSRYMTDAMNILTRRWNTTGILDLQTNNRLIWIDDTIFASRTIRHTPESYVEAWGRQGEIGFVTRDGKLHINVQEFERLPLVERRIKMREFIAHERAHQAIMNLPEWRLTEIHESFMRNEVFLITWDSWLYGLHIWRVTSPFDITNEILATMIGRYRVGKSVPDSFIQALRDVHIISWSSVERSAILTDINRTFGVNTSRRLWDEVWGVRNIDRLSEAAMRGDELIWRSITIPWTFWARLNWTIQWYNKDTWLFRTRLEDWRINELYFSTISDIDPEIRRIMMYQIEPDDVLHMSDGSQWLIRSRIWNTISLEISMTDWTFRRQDMSIDQIPYNYLVDFRRLDIHNISDFPIFQNLDHAIQYISQMPELWITWSRFYSKWELIDIIERVKQWDYIAIQYLTSTGWLRQRVWDSIPEVQKRDDYIRYLWPQGFDAHFQQGPIWNCYFLAALRWVQTHRQWRNILRHMIQPEIDGSVTIRFSWNQSINISGNDLAELSWRGMSWDLWNRILERAHARLTNHLLGHQSGTTTIQSQRPDWSWWMSFEGWYMIDSLEHIFWNYIRQRIYIYDNPREMLSFLNGINDAHKNNYILTLASRPPSISRRWRWDSQTFQVIDAYWYERNIYHSHAYTIEDIDISRWMVLMVNPHNTANERYWMHFSHLSDNFWLQWVELDLPRIATNLAM